MKYTIPLAAVLGLALFAFLGSQIIGMQYIFGILVPYAAVAVFIVGFCYKVINWGRSPVPFKIPTTCGQGYSLSWIKRDRLEAPLNSFEVAGRMFLEIVLFRSLWRNTKSEVHAGPKLTYESSKWLWLFAILFHYSFLVVLLRHLRLFLEPIPSAVSALEFADGILQIGAPTMYLTDATLVLGLILLFGRRILNRQVRYISLPNDYFPLFLLFGIAVTGILMRFFLRGGIDITVIKTLAVGLVTFHPTLAGDIGGIFYAHLFLICCLLAYFPFSKLMHMGGVFLSPTRNMANDSRMRRHVNPWNDPEIKPHSYAGYEDEFREDMIEQGNPVEKEMPKKADDETVA